MMTMTLRSSAGVESQWAVFPGPSKRQPPAALMLLKGETQAYRRALLPMQPSPSKPPLTPSAVSSKEETNLGVFSPFQMLSLTQALKAMLQSCGDQRRNTRITAATGVPRIQSDECRGARPWRLLPWHEVICSAADPSGAGVMTNDPWGQLQGSGSLHSWWQSEICSLERFRSLREKLVLLDEAVAVHDGNVITAILIFLKRTLKREILFQELEVRQVALRHLIHFLKETGEQTLLLDLLRFLDRTEEVALSRYREHLSIQDAEKRREFLKGCIRLPFSSEDAVHVQDHYTLLERQIIIEANDRHLEASGQSEIFRKYPRKASILNMPLVTTLFYSCFYHYTEAEGTFSSPTNLKKTFKIPDKQYVLTALAARAKLRAWHDVDALLTTKNWLGYTKKRAPIGFHRVVEILQRNSAPVQVLQEYVRLVEDVETRLNLAMKYKCHDVVIDTYRDLKDRHQLMAYRCKVERGSAEEDKIDSILSNLQIRWKN
ncbi:spermatogenesis-defective protein 39 homolog isoform X2 [Natator depressus]|uniref:spermatogenesis-defective protein 39 homolog isoform X2 n=1 Tax=Natator depressus TaxID=27790 RepID=UPI003EBA48F9